MSRAMKFRAWDGKRMMNRTLFDRNWYTADDKCICGAMPNDERTLKVMQYTGLKDKNGIEIYESDVIRIQCEDALGNKIDKFNEIEVYYDPYSCCYCPNFSKLSSEYIKIIGNIYEDKGLVSND